jgi:hypothetical protein
MADVIDAKDMGSGIINGLECDHLAFRTAEVDWQIWIAQGEAPYPCRFTITSKAIAQGPQYRIEVRDWQANADVPASRFEIALPETSKDVAFEMTADVFRDLPAHFMTGDDK